MARYTQLDLIPKKKNSRVFGGAHLHLKRRAQRPLSTKEPIHIVLRSSWACGPFGLLRLRSHVDRILRHNAKRYGVQVYRSAINSNHIHLLVRLTNRQLYRRFIRAFSSHIAQVVMRGLSFREFRQAHHSPPTELQGLGQRFWQFRPFTRIVSWGRDFDGCAKYVERNTLEADGFIPYQERGKRARPFSSA